MIQNERKTIKKTPENRKEFIIRHKWKKTKQNNNKQNKTMSYLFEV